MLVFHGGTPTWRLHTGLCKFVQNFSTNILSLGKRTDLDKFHLYQSPITSQFLDFINLMVFDLFLYCVTVQAKTTFYGLKGFGTTDPSEAGVM